MSYYPLMFRAVLGLLVLFAAGCGNDASAPAGPARRPLYFDVKGLVEEQMQALSQRRAAVRKRVTLRERAPEAVRVPVVKWADELQVFLQADINKTALRGAYTIDSAQLPGGATRRTYTRRTPLATASVEQLSVVQQGAMPQQLSATIIQSNPLFSTRKQLQMEFRGGQLARYGVKGTQKLIFFDALEYSTDAAVE